MQIPKVAFNEPEVDFHEVFKVSAMATALLTPDLVIIDANDEFLDAVGRSLDEVVGQYVFRHFPKMPVDPAKPKWTALEAALISGEREVLRLTRYDFEDPGSPGVFEERYWSSVVTPRLCRWRRAEAARTERAGSHVAYDPVPRHVRLGLSVYAHVVPGDQRRAAVAFAALIGQA